MSGDDQRVSDAPAQPKKARTWYTGDVPTEGWRDRDNFKKDGSDGGYRAWTKSRTFWTRLEPRTRDPDFKRTLRAEIHDPAWFLTRQWQMGEFEGEDAGSPVIANLEYDRELLGRVRLGLDNGDTTTDYAGRPLEAVVEREPATTELNPDETPGLRTRVEAGQAFLRALAEADYTDGGTAYTAEDIAAASGGDKYVVEEPDEPMDAAARQFAALADGRAVDGHAVYEALEGVPKIDALDWRGVSWGSASDLPLPKGGSLNQDAKQGLKAFYDHYVDLYDEPDPNASDPWKPDRLEYGFEVSTGPQGDETVLAADEYGGGHLDWYSFSVDRSGSSLNPPATGNGGDDLSTGGTDEAVLSRAEFKGMPVPRWWEFENAEVNLDEVPAGPEELTKALLLDFTFAYGNDWFVLPMDAPIGSLTHLSSFTVTDNFGIESDIEPVTTQAPNWNAFMHPDLPTAGGSNARPGLFLPPTLGESATSEPLERVYFARDQMANLAFAVEERIPGPTGDPRERAEFDDPELVIERIATGEGVDEERIVLRNVGDAPLDITDWTVEVVAEASHGTGSPSDLHTFSTVDGEPFVLGPDDTVVVHTGTAPAGDIADTEEVYAGESDRVWSGAKKHGSVTVRRGGSDPLDERFVTTKLVTSPDAALPDYRLATNVPDHWFPMKPLEPKTSANAGKTDTYRLGLSLLLDADAMDDPLYRIPVPQGRILDEKLKLYEEEVPRSGREVERYDQLARWTDGSTWLWTSREASNGRGEAASRLRFDVLEEPDADTASEKRE